MFTVNHRIKRIFFSLLFGFSLILFPLLSHALFVEDVPNPRPEYGVWVTDMANILSERTETELNQMLSELEASTGTELAVVTVLTTAPSPTAKAFTTELFNTWGIGKVGEDNGVLFLTSVGDRRVEIETGYGVEGILPDAKVGKIINNQITPKLRRGDWDGGILAGTIALVTELSGTRPVTEFSDPSSPNPLLGITALIAVIFSFFGYKKVESITHKPLSLAPKGRSLVIGRFDNRLTELQGWIYSAVFSLGLALILLTLIAASSGILWPGFGIGSLPFFSFLELTGLSLVFWGVVSILFTYIVSPRLIALFQAKIPGKCQKCENPLIQLNPTHLSDRFTPPQQVAKRLGSTRFEGWHCPHCY
ncbi:MAG: TPM domain-containing protein, partial [Chroococcales cyanobacterium]